ncbi:MAG: AraC family transcriptional regulator [Spirosomataceae bacterium]
MKPQLLKAPKGLEQSFTARQDVVLHFYNRWHYHPELELVQVEQGTGTLFVGDSIEHFQHSDLLLIGANLPHYWRCDEKYFQANSGLYAQATVVHFLSDVWGDTFLNLPENQAIRELFAKAGRGIRFGGDTKLHIKNLLNKLLHNENSNRLILLLQILEVLAQCQEATELSKTYLPQPLDEDDTDRINRIYNYSLTHFQRKISIDEIAEVANVSPHSFCRYFKSRSRKTYSQFLQELRVGHACKLLIDEHLGIAQICYESGFNNFSNFNKYFKIITGKSPLQYQKEHRVGNKL